MKCKKVYDIIGYFTDSPKKKYILVNGAMLMPYVLKDGKQNRLSVTICTQTNISNVYNAVLLTIKTDGNNSSLRNEEVKDFFHFELKIPNEQFDFKKEKKIRMIVIHDDKMCEEPDPGLIECAREYVSHAGYLEGWEFDSRRCGEWIVFHGPKKSGESVMVGM